MEGLERLLFVCREVDVFKIPPRSAAGGHRSGDWRVDDKIFTARCRVLARGDDLEVRLEDSQTGELFGVCPVPPGQLRVAVEPAADSSRNFVVRLEDPVSKRHAFLGINFAERSTAFDFTVALNDHEKQTRREQTLNSIGAVEDKEAAAARALPEAAALYKKQDLSLGEGSTLRLEVKAPVSAGGAAPGREPGGFLSRLQGPSGALPAPGGPSGAVRLAPPPAAATQPPPSGAAAPSGWATFD